MKYIITEEQNERLTLFRKLRRRDGMIKEAIHRYSKRPLTNFQLVVESVFIDLLNELQIRINSKPFYWLKAYILDNYSGLIYTELSKNNKEPEQIDESVIDDIEDNKLLKIIDKLVRYIYGSELRMEKNEDGYLRFFSSGPVAPYHRNLAGRVWMDDNRLLNMISNFFGTNWDETLALIAFYFSAKYNIKTMDAKPHSNWEDWDDFDYSQFDDPNYVVEDDDDY